MTVRQTLWLWQSTELLVIFLLLSSSLQWPLLWVLLLSLVLMALIRLVVIGLMTFSVHIYFGKTPVCGFRQFVFYWLQESKAFISLYGFWQMLPRSAFPPSRQIQPVHVIFVHGFLCNNGFWFRLSRACRNAGFSFSYVELPKAYADIDEFSALIDLEITRIRRLSADTRINLVAFSMGGLACRNLLVDADDDVNLFTLNTPHQGTLLARISQLTGAANGRQMLPDSDWLKHLQELEARQTRQLNGVRYGFWSLHDTIVLPAERGQPPFRGFARSAKGHLQAALDHRLHHHLIRLISLSSGRPVRGHQSFE